MLGKMKVEPVSDGDSVASDAFPDSGTVKRKLPFMVCWDVDDAAESVEKMLDASRVFYPGHDRPFRLDGEEISYLHEPTAVEVRDTNEGGGAAALTFRVIAKRPVNIHTIQKR